MARGGDVAERQAAPAAAIKQQVDAIITAGGQAGEAGEATHPSWLPFVSPGYCTMQK